MVIWLPLEKGRAKKNRVLFIWVALLFFQRKEENRIQSGAESSTQKGRGKDHLKSLFGRQGDHLEAPAEKLT